MFLWVRERADLYLYLTRPSVGACGGLNNPLDCLDSAWGNIHTYDRAYLLYSQQLNIVDDYILCTRNNASQTASTLTSPQSLSSSKM